MPIQSLLQEDLRGREKGEVLEGGSIGLLRRSGSEGGGGRGTGRRGWEKRWGERRFRRPAFELEARSFVGAEFGPMNQGETAAGGAEVKEEGETGREQ